MISFASDYTTGCHPAILEAFARTNLEHSDGYGGDQFCAMAEQLIRQACGRPDAQVDFIAGGTQTNQLVIDAMIPRYEGVLCATTAHINCHEAGAPEFTGHKCLPLPHRLGKIDARDITAAVKAWNEDDSREHLIRPGMVYITHPTEYGTLYTKAELSEIHDACVEADIPLFLDGARLGYGLASHNTDVTLQDIAALTDVFYIGGTKVGALCGEAVVFTHGNKPKAFLTVKKQHGALLAKGRVLGVQFQTLFTDGLYMEVSRNAISKADRLKEIIERKGIPYFLKTDTNQQFVILETDRLAKLEERITVSRWQKLDDEHWAVRLCTTWSTTDEELKALEEAL